MKRRAISALITLLCCTMASLDAIAGEIPAWFRSRLASSQFCAVCEVAVPETVSEKPSWKILQLYRGRRKFLHDVPAIMLEDPKIGSPHLFFFGRNRISRLNAPPLRRMPLLNRRSPSNPDGSLTPPPSLADSYNTKEMITFSADYSVENGAVSVNLDERATGVDVPSAKITLRRIAALLKKCRKEPRERF